MAALSPVLDHVVIDVRDRVDEAMRCFQSLGFQLTPRGRHTLGSVNHLAMFATDYLELLGFAGDAIRPEIMRFPVGLNGLVFKTGERGLGSRAGGGSGSPDPAGSILLPSRHARRRGTRCAVSHHPARSGPGGDGPRLFLRTSDTRPRMAARVADPPERSLRHRPGGGRDRRSSAHGKAVPRSLRRRDRSGSQWGANNRRRSRPGGALHAGCGSSRIRRDGSRGGRPNRTYGGSRDQSPVAARGGTMPALRPGLTRRAAPLGRAGRRRIQYGYRILGVSDTDAASGRGFLRVRFFSTLSATCPHAQGAVRHCRGASRSTHILVASGSAYAVGGYLSSQTSS